MKWRVVFEKYGAEIEGMYVGVDRKEAAEPAPVTAR